MANLSPKWRDFLTHLGVYAIVIGALGMINLLSGSDYPWFLWPALGWGAGLAIHFWNLLLATLIKDMSQKWRGFIEHLGSYVVIISMLGMMNLLTGSDYPWFLWPAIGWGAGLAIHFLSLLLGKEERQEGSQQRRQVRAERREERRQRHRDRRAGQVEPDDTEMIEDTARAESPPRPLEYPVITKGKPVNQVVGAYVDKARAYQAQIDGLIKASANASARTRLQDLAGQVQEWVEAIEDLARRIDSFQQNALIRQDFEAVPQAIADLEARLANETDPAIRSQLERTLINRKNQRDALTRLQNIIKQAELQIESTLSALGTIYSQLLTGQSTDHVADYNRLSAEVDEEVQLLQDRLEALEEVKLSQM